ncbi:hypothetical protein MPSEU_000492400 [Mayamaea pseudoterrestris]|nr:hypothetical protein MPSEU_000492400 [Mayamaea pseudoterrestris]
MDQYHDNRPKRRLSNEDSHQQASKRHEHDPNISHPIQQSGDWNEHLHRAFVAAVFETGLKHASPSVIMEQMTLSMAAITSERVKSHLQKYRNNKDKNKAQFMDEYDSFLQKALTVGTAGGKVNQSSTGDGASFLTPEALVQMLGADSIVGGDLPALLTYAVMYSDGLSERHQAPNEGSLSSSQHQLQGLSAQPHLPFDAIKTGSQEYTNYMSKQEGTKIPFPVLSEEERNSPLGCSIGHVMALFCSLTQQIVAERAKRGDEALPSLPRVLSTDFRVEHDDEDGQH